MNENNIDTNCIFCKVGAHIVPHNRVYENEKFVAFLDIHPISKGHTLIIPKNHIVWMQDASDETISEIFVFSKKFMLAQKESIKCDYVQVQILGKDVPHFHIHLIPRYFGDRLETHIEAIKYEENEEKEIINKIIENLN